MTPRGPALLVVAALAFGTAGCAEPTDAAPQSASSSVSDEPTGSAEPTGAATEQLPLGKDDLPVTPGPHLSPEGFAPALELVVPEGWTSVHRDPDAFDLGMADPERDAPLVAVVFLTPEQADAAAAIAAVDAQATGEVRAVEGMIGQIDASGLEIAGGSGELVQSVYGSIALDAQPGQRVRVLAADVDGAPLVVLVLVPDGRRWAQASAAADDLLAGTRAVG